jgi:aryl-alcohol dehydrogenase-like predicted oxidoreductase
MSDDPADQGLSPAQIRKQVDASLERLRVDHVDLYQAHRFDAETPLEDTVEALQQVVTDGKARYLGFSEWTPDQVRAAIEIGGEDLFVSSQPQYSMLWRAPEDEVFPLCMDHGISQIVWSPLAQGLLTGKYKPGQEFPADSRFAHESMGGAKDVIYSEEAAQAVQRLVPIADDLGLTLAELALAWTLRGPELASAIIGASRPEQVHANAAAAGISLDDDVVAACDEALGDVPVTGQRLAVHATSSIKRR